MLSRVVSLIVLVLLSCGSTLAVAAGPEADSGGGQAVARVMILPFDGTAAGNFAYLTDSVRSMVSSRLAAKNGVEIVDYALKAQEIKKLENGEKILPKNGSLFTRFHVDYVISGGLYKLQSGLKIQVLVTGRHEPDSPGKFSAQAVNEGHILEAIGNLVEDIAARGIGIGTPETPAVADNGAKGAEGFATEHPEKQYRRGLFEQGTIVTKGEKGEQKVQALGMRRSKEIDSMIVSLATGDFDGDGVPEVVAASRTSLTVYSFKGIRLNKLGVYKFPATYKVHAVNIADLDGDGNPEIYVSANEEQRAASAIFSWSKSAGLRQMLGNIGWYIRPVLKPGQGWMLAGQRASRFAGESYIANGVYRLNIASGFSAVHEGEALSLPKNVGLFDFAWADLDGDGAPEVVAVDAREKLLVYNSANQLLWVSDKDYGGSRNFIGPTLSSSIRVAGEDGTTASRRLRFIPTRIIAADLTGDGRQEVIVGRNKRMWTKWLVNTREYDGGSVVCLSWNDSAMREMWRTNAISGYVADYELSPFKKDASIKNGTAMEDLYIAQIPDRKFFGLLTGNSSRILRYDLEVQTGRKAKTTK